MVGGTFAPMESLCSSRLELYKSRMTGYTLFVAVLAASGGLLFGYDIGITGGVESMPSFQQKFFPDVYEAEQAGVGNTSPYCTYNSHSLQFFTSALFLAGMVTSPFASIVTRMLGRKLAMIAAALSFLIGAGLNAGAQNLAMLYVGRIMLGIGVGFGNQVVPLYLSETAPFHLRGALNQFFQFATTIGILVAQLINYGVRDWSEGWRLSLGLAGVPALILLTGGIVLPESPNSLVERGHVEKGRKVLMRLRGTEDVDAELMDIQEATEIAETVTMRQSWQKMFTRRYAPMLIVTVLISMFQQLTGINSIMFYVPVLFRSLGKGAEAALLNTVIIGAVNVLATLVAIFTVDKFGRKILLIEGGTQMVITMTITAVVLGVEFGKYTDGVLPTGTAIGVLVVICVFVAGFAWSWGPCGWTIPSEIQTLETRAAGMASAVFVNFLFSFIIGQVFLSMLCAMRWGVFLFFAGWVVVMTLFVIFFVPETRRVPTERVPLLFARHKIWKKVMGPAATDVLTRHETKKAMRKAQQAEEGQDKKCDELSDPPSSPKQKDQESDHGSGSSHNA